MEIFNSSGEVLFDVTSSDSSYSLSQIRAIPSLYLYFSTSEPLIIPIGSYVVFKALKYYLLKSESVVMHHGRNYEYTLLLQPFDPSKYKVRNPVDHRFKFSYTAKPKEHLQLVVDSLNSHDAGWSIGSCVEDNEKLIPYNHINGIEALNQIADTYNTEWYIENRVVSLCKIKKNFDSPLPLSYLNGIKGDIKRSLYNNAYPVGLVSPEGGSRNIVRSTYGSPTLLLPKSQTVKYDGTHFSWETGFSDANSRTYKTDAYGFSAVSSLGVSDVEESLDCSEIYPSRVCTVSSVSVVDSAKNFYDIIDNTIPEALNFSTYQIAEEKITIEFQTGELAGQGSFDVNYFHDTRRFEIIPKSSDGIIMPGASFIPSVGDKFAVFNIDMPQAYIEDNATHTGASWDMLKKCIRFLYENEEIRYTFPFQLDGVYSREHWLEIGGKISVGSFVSFTAENFQQTPVKIRITGIKDYVNRPYSPELTLSNVTIAGGVSSSLVDQKGDEVIIDSNRDELISYTKRRFRDAKETAELLAQSMHNFSTAINPVAIQTMSLLVGDESLQFRFVNSKTAPKYVEHAVTYNQETKVLVSDAGILQHMTLGIANMSSTHAPSEYHFWDMSSYTSPVLSDGSKSYYLYAKCSKTTSSGTFLLSETPIDLESVSGFYHLLLGILNTEFEGERSFATVHGFTEVLPGRITVDRIVSPDGGTYFDISAGKIGGKITFGSGSSGYNNLSDKPDLSPLTKGVSDALSEAENASNTANTANNNANSKARVIYQATAPTSGMRTNDLWVDGVNIYRYSGTAWVLASKYDTTETVVNGGLITTGAIAFGSTGGMAGSGSVRIWSGGNSGANGTPPSDPTFKVLNDGSVYGRNNIICRDANGNEVCGFSSYGTDTGNYTDYSSFNLGSIRVFAGGTYSNRDNAPMRVGSNGVIVSKAITFSSTASSSYAGNMVVDARNIIAHKGAILRFGSSTELREIIIRGGISEMGQYSAPMLEIIDKYNQTYYDTVSIVKEGSQRALYIKSGGGGQAIYALGNEYFGLRGWENLTIDLGVAAPNYGDVIFNNVKDYAGTTRYSGNLRISRDNNKNYLIIGD